MSSLKFTDDANFWLLAGKYIVSKTDGRTDRHSSLLHIYVGLAPARPDYYSVPYPGDVGINIEWVGSLAPLPSSLLPSSLRKEPGTDATSSFSYWRSGLVSLNLVCDSKEYLCFVSLFAVLRLGKRRRVLCPYVVWMHYPNVVLSTQCLFILVDVATTHYSQDCVPSTKDSETIRRVRHMTNVWTLANLSTQYFPQVNKMAIHSHVDRQMWNHSIESCTRSIKAWRTCVKWLHWCHKITRLSTEYFR